METLQVKPNTGKGHMTYQLTPNWGGRGCCTSRRTAASQQTLDLQKNRKKKHDQSRFSKNDQKCTKCATMG